MKIVFTRVLFLVMPILIYSQENLNLQQHKEYYIKGDVAVVGNTIIGKDKLKPFNNLTFINDEVNAKYVDIDNDQSTFSSSSATLQIPENNQNIISATLYWSAIYSYEKGRKSVSGKNLVYKGNDKRDSTINIIKFKSPGLDYKTITGEIVFDGYGKKGFEDAAPYVCYTDVTHIIKESKSISGEYVVGNIKATQGYVSGGSSGGWVLYIVYESVSETPKYISTYHGLVDVAETEKALRFSNFKTNQTGKINAEITIGALEGDSKLKKDQCGILIPSKGNKKKYEMMSSSLRPEKNFFNSNISANSEEFKERNPSSKNNLGFDLVQIEVPNEKNRIITNNMTETELLFSSKWDRFFIFFTAFKIEIDPTSYQKTKNQEIVESSNAEKIKTPETLSKNQTSNKEEINATQLNQAPLVLKKEMTTHMEPKEISSSQIKTTSSEVYTEKEIEDINRLIRNRATRISGVDRGYHLITNVFSQPHLAAKWERFLKSKGYTPKRFIDPKKKWHYMSIESFEDPYVAYKKAQKLAKINYFKDIWVFKINF